MSTMLAARADRGESALRLERLPVPEPGDDDVVIRVRAAGLTHGVLSLWRSGRLRILPTVLGHEIAGTVASTGRNVHSVDTGLRVRVHPTLSCRRCERCLAGDEVWCEASALIGHALGGEAGMPLYERYHDGGLAEYVRVPEWSVMPLPERVSYELGAKLHSVAVAHRALRTAGAGAGTTLVVTGATGAQGAITIRLAAALGAGVLVAVGRTERGVERAAALAPGLVRPVALERLPAGWERTGALTDRIRHLTGGGGADAVVDFLPAAPAVTLQAVASLRRGGRAALAGGCRDELRLPYARLVTQGWTVAGSLGAGRPDAERVLDLAGAGAVRLDDLVTHRIPLERVGEAVDLVERRDESLRLLTVQPV